MPLRNPRLGLLFTGFLLALAPVPSPGHAGRQGRAPARSAKPPSTPLRLEDSLLSLSLERAGQVRIWLKTSRQPTLLAASPGTQFFSLTTRGGQRFDVQLDLAHVAQEPLSTEFGKGTRRRITGAARTGSSFLELELTLDHYDDVPGWVMAQLRFRVPGSAKKPLEVETVDLESLRAPTPPPSGSGPYWSFQGASDVREHYVRPVLPGFHKENFLGVTLPGYGGGIPVVDLWRKEGGLAVGHLEMEHQELLMPVVAHQDGSIDLTIRQNIEHAFKPGESWQSPYLFVAVHQGDFYAPLRTYGDLMARRGLPHPHSPPEAYEPYWSTWGYGYDFRLADIRSKLPLFQALGIPWIVVDDRWFDAAGDWEPRLDIYPRGEEDFKAMVDELHGAGFKVQLWIVPSEADAGLDLKAWQAAHPELKNLSHFVPSAVKRARLLDEHPDWVILDERGEPPLSKRGYYYLCPALPEVQNYFRSSVQKWFREWGVDGLKQDAVYICPPCYNPMHHHASPEDAPQAYARLEKIIFESASATKPNCVVYSCPCGVAPEFTWLPWLNQMVTADPVGPQQMRSRTKALRALGGDQVAVFSDFIEMGDFASALGTGAVPGTEFRSLTPAEKSEFEKWFGLYRSLQLSHATYLNLYDIAFDRPEAHVLRKGDKLYYAFFTRQPEEDFTGPVEFRGLSAAGLYRVYDYYHARDLGMIRGYSPRLPAAFRGFLLLEVTPVTVVSRGGR